MNQEDQTHILAAQGWLKLGSYLEANNALDEVTAALRAHPDVLRLRWRVYAMARKWDGALAIGKTLSEHEPEEEYSWLCHAAALHGMGETYEAYQILVAAIDEFGHFDALATEGMTVAPINLHFRPTSRAAARRWVASPLLLLLALVAGCNSTLDVYESRVAAPVLSTNTDGTLSIASPDPSSGVTLVTGSVQRVDLPFVNSPSMAGDKATCMILVPAHSIPANPGSSRVALHYDNHGWLQGLQPGIKVVLRFQKSGKFDGVHAPRALPRPNAPNP